MESKYLLDIDKDIAERGADVSPEWAERYKDIAEAKDLKVFTFIMQYIFM